jgi:hypothetical protein
LLVLEEKEFGWVTPPFLATPVAHKHNMLLKNASLSQATRVPAYSRQREINKVFTDVILWWGRFGARGTNFVVSAYAYVCMYVCSDHPGDIPTTPCWLVMNS